MGGSFAQVSASSAETDGLVLELEGAASLSSLGREFVDFASAVLLGDTADSHLASLSAGDHLVGSDCPVVTAVTLGFAHGSALAGVLDGLLGGLGRLDDDDFVATSVSSSLRSWCVSDVKERLTASFTHSHQLELLPLLLNDASTLERAFHDVCVAYRLGEDYDEMRRQGGTWWVGCSKCFRVIYPFSKFSCEIKQRSLLITN